MHCDSNISIYSIIFSYVWLYYREYIAFIEVPEAFSTKQINQDFTLLPG